MVHLTSVPCSVDFNELSPDVCNYLKSENSNVQNQLDMCLKVQEGVIHLTEDIAITDTHIYDDDVRVPYKFAGVTPEKIQCLSNIHTNIQQRLDQISDTIADAASAKLLVLSGINKSTLVNSI